MKKYAATFVILLFISVIAWLALNRYKSSSSSTLRSEASKLNSVESVNSGAQQASATKQGKLAADKDAAAEAAERAERLRDRQARVEQADREYNTPITFYGLVLDERDQPVSEAVAVYACVDGSFEGERKLQSDTEGRFTISDVRGKHLRVGVSHPKYYVPGNYWFYYYYAGTGNSPIHVPNSGKPEIFRLRKKGEAAELVHQSDKILFDKGEEQRSFSLFDHTRRRDQPEYVIIRAVDNGRVNSRGKRVLDLELSTPSGGLQLRTDPFQFIAPTEGYQSTLVTPPAGINPVGLFVRFNSGNYGRFTIAGAGSQYDVESYLNPDNSPNLEYDPAKEITMVRDGRMGIRLVYPPKDDPPPKKP